MDLFTTAEIDDLATRWLILKELEAGTSQREVATRLNVSISKVTRGSKVIQNESRLLKKLLKIELNY